MACAYWSRTDFHHSVCYTGGSAVHVPAVINTVVLVLISSIPFLQNLLSPLCIGLGHTQIREL